MRQPNREDNMRKKIEYDFSSPPGRGENLQLIFKWKQA